MGKKIFSFAFVVLCLAICAVLSVGFLASGPSAAGANEVLSSEPALTTRDGGPNYGFLGDCAEYFNDHFFMRRELISAHNMLVTELFSSSPEDSVLLGSDGWLYYGSTIDDYTGRAKRSERELYSMARNLFLMQEYCAQRGMDFLFTAAPNKNSVYPEHMPDLGAVSSEHDVERLYALLDGMDVGYLDLHEPFEAENDVLYFAHDSHWNTRGAALAADAINSALGRGSSYFDGPFDIESPHSGDLYEMLYPAMDDPESDMLYGGELVCDYGGGPSRPDSITLNTTGAGEGSLLCYRDSFGELLHPFLADSFASARFSRSTSYDLTGDYDCVVIELVERNLGYLLSYLPVMPSPVRELPEAEAGDVTVAVGLQNGVTVPEGCALWRGTLASGPDAGSPVYIVSGGEAYECFLLAGGGFAAYMPEGAQPERVAYYANGVLTACNAG